MPTHKDSYSNENKPHVHSVQKALQLLEILSTENREMSLTELSESTNWPKSTVYGLLATMRSFGYVDQSAESGKYWLGIHLFELGSQVARSWNIREIAHPIMKQLSEEIGEMVQFASEWNDEVLYLEKVESNHLLNIVSKVGVRLPLYCTGLGKVLLAYMPSPKQRLYFANNDFSSITPRTITSSIKMKEELSHVRKCGYAIDDGETMEGLRCVAAPIHGATGDVHYALSISGTTVNMSGNKFERATQLVVKAADSISYGLGYKNDGIRKESVK